jgi:hypothetical protein
MVDVEHRSVVTTPARHRERLQNPVSLYLVEFPVPTVAVKLENDSAVRSGLPAIEAAV